MIIALLSIGLAWLVTTVIYVICFMFIEVTRPYLWLSFIYAITISTILAVIFSAIWANKIIRTVSISLLVWSAALSVYCSLGAFIIDSNFPHWMVFLIAIPLQLLIILWYFLKVKIYFTRIN